jgi:hypothetical protein
MDTEDAGVCGSPGAGWRCCRGRNAGRGIGRFCIQAILGIAPLAIFDAAADQHPSITRVFSIALAGAADNLAENGLAHLRSYDADRQSLGAPEWNAPRTRWLLIDALPVYAAAPATETPRAAEFAARPGVLDLRTAPPRDLTEFAVSGGTVSLRGTSGVGLVYRPDAFRQSAAAFALSAGGHRIGISASFRW